MLKLTTGHGREEVDEGGNKRSDNYNEFSFKKFKIPNTIEPSYMKGT